ncbi:hypothetical protein C2G38_2226281 [Gigaspora rosea]|uniref:Aspartic peptidase DDI1-type domain-containing protein n=1 Tax=Gigaspora rosea TaxID=44941 RepID=A0A397U6N1_9GLOM|nr:hypothetical protein C2G38_2226281 [Gigaspora rosea]
MATIAGDLTSIAPLIAKIPNYSEQIPPDEWYQRINQILTLPSITAAAFDNLLRADILKSKMAGKYTTIPAQHAGNNIDTPARFIVWLHHKYQTETVGTQQVATQRLAQEKFLPFDNPEIYEARIRPLLLGVADELKNIWLERSPNLYKGSIPNQISQAPPITSQSTTISTKSNTEPCLDNSGITKTEVENIVNSRLDLRSQQPTSQSLYDETPEFVLMQAPSLPPKPQIKKNITSNTNDVDEITKGMADMSLNIDIILVAVLERKINNNAHIDSDSDTSTNGSESDSDSSSESSSESESKAEINKKSKTHKSCKIKNAEAPPLVSVPISKKEKQSLKSLSQDEQSHLEKIIKKIIEEVLNEKFGTITTPLFQPKAENSKTLADSEDDEFIDDPMEIDFVQRKEPATDVVTTKCKIKRLVIPGVTVDPGANFAIMSENIAKRLKLEIDTKEKHDLRGIATTPTESLGIVRNVPVNFAPGCTIYADFAVVKYPKPMLILPNTLLDKYNYNLLASKRELRLECNGKEFFIPVNMHKVKNKLEDLSDDGILKKNPMNYEELEKMLYTTLISKAKLIEINKNLRSLFPC